jgi:hypothetical protein
VLKSHEKKIDRQPDRFDGDLGHKKHKNRLSERPQIVDRKTEKLDRRADRQSADLVFWDTLYEMKKMRARNALERSGEV